MVVGAAQFGADAGVGAMDRINLEEKFAQVGEHWSPKLIGELNGQYVKLAKGAGELVWHAHAGEDEFFLVA